MAEFGNRPSGSTSAPDGENAPVGGAGSANGTLAFSFVGLVGALIVSSVITFAFVNFFANQGRDPGSPTPDVITLFVWLMLGTAVYSSCIATFVYCLVAHLASILSKSSAYWLFATAGFLSAVFSAFLTSDLLGPLFPLMHGVVATSTYWLIATRRR
jgi:hypothetical protein